MIQFCEGPIHALTLELELLKGQFRRTRLPCFCKGFGFPKKIPFSNTIKYIIALEEVSISVKT
jgi:hypothetical protein